MLLICANCQTPNEDSHRFCSYCGAPLAGSQPAAASPQPPATVPAAPPTPPATPPPAPQQPLATPPPAPEPAPTPASAAPPPPPAPAPQPASAAPPPPPAAAAPPAAPPPPPVAPMSTPPASEPAAARLARLPANVLIGGVVAVLLATAAVGVAVGGVLHPTSGPGSSATPTQAPFPTFSSHGQPTAQPPGPTQGPTVTAVPVATAGPPVTQAPVVTAAPQPTPNTGTGSGATQTIDVANMTALAPAGWKVYSTKDYFIDLGTPSGQLVLISGAYGQSVDQYFADLLANIQKTSPDAKTCVATGAADVPFGPTGGKTIAYCYTAKYSDGTSYQAKAFFFCGVDGAGVVYTFEVFADQTYYSKTVDEIVAAIKDGTLTVTYKLLAAQ